MRLPRVLRRRKTPGNRGKIPSQRASPEDAPPPSGNMRTLGVSALVTAVITLLVTAVLTPFGAAIQNTIGRTLGTDTGREPSAAAPASRSPSGTKLKWVTSRSGALSLRVPARWGRGDAGKPFVQFGYVDEGHQGKVYPQEQLVAGTASALDAPNDWSLPRVGLAASTVAAQDLGLVGADRTRLHAWARHYVESHDWTNLGCVLVGEEEPRVAGYVAVVRRWEGCAGLPDTRFWELAAASDDGRVLVVDACVHQAGLSASTARTVLTSFSVAPEKLPGAPVSGGDVRMP